MNTPMDDETYDALRLALTNAHVEDFINLVTLALMNRADTEYNATIDGEDSGQFIVPGATSDSNPEMRYPDRKFTVVIRQEEI